MVRILNGFVSNVKSQVVKRDRQGETGEHYWTENIWNGKLLNRFWNRERERES